MLAVPILDTGFVIAKRIKYRQPIYAADRWHFHHRMANIGFSQRRTLAYLYGWALVMAGLALALRFVPYCDNHGHFDPVWTAVIVVCLVAALAASVYLRRRARDPQAAQRRGSASWSGPRCRSPPRRRWTRASPASSRPARFAAVDPETGEFEAIEPRDGRVRASPGTVRNGTGWFDGG